MENFIPSGTLPFTATLAFNVDKWSMNEQNVDYWIRYFDEHDILQVNFKKPEYDELVRDLASCRFENPIQLLGAIARAVRLTKMKGETE